MNLIDARTAPADPVSVQRLRETGLEYRIADLADEQVATAFARADARGFLDADPSEEQLARMRTMWLSRRNIGVYEADAAAGTLPVATVNSWVTPMTVPGGEIPMWAISSVTVAGTHRRRGIARSLLEGELRAAATAGVPIAGLTASEATIYGRYGFAPSVPVARISVDTRRAGWIGAPTPGTLAYLERPEVAAEIGALHERSRGRRSGQIPGWEARWQRMAGLTEGEGKGTDVRGVCYRDAEGIVRGAIAFSLKEQPEEFRFTLSIRHLAAETDEALRALWGFAVNHDLVSKVEVDLRPVDDPILHLVADQRAVEFTVHDHGWLRVLDVPTALHARRYDAPADAVLRIDDPHGLAEGTWRVRIDADGVADVQPADGAPDVSLGVAELSAIYAGGVPLTQLAAAGRVHGDAQAIGALTKAFRTDPAPLLGIWY
ncbi:GNAT family N-acetyltransferase [Microbacterium sp. NPDC058345]|uniref:GNAT family N-acetyltransferase n=1 Tax=Microbacterium sp. NPDC058345 TaxID=3346455 RepID=UPI0036511570